MMCILDEVKEEQKQHRLLLETGGHSMVDGHYDAALEAAAAAASMPQSMLVHPFTGIFKQPEAYWECPSCRTTNTLATPACAVCHFAKDGTTIMLDDTVKDNGSSSLIPGSDFSFGLNTGRLESPNLTLSNMLSNPVANNISNVSVGGGKSFMENNLSSIPVLTNSMVTPTKPVQEMPNNIGQPVTQMAPSKMLNNFQFKGPTVTTTPLMGNNKGDGDKLLSGTSKGVVDSNASISGSAPFSDLSLFSSTPGFGDLKASAESGNTSMFGKTPSGKFTGK